MGLSPAFINNPVVNGDGRNCYAYPEGNVVHARAIPEKCICEAQLA